MSEKHTPEYRPFLYFVLILAGSGATLVGVTWDPSPPWMGILAILLTVIGSSTGIWMLISPSWRRHPHHVRIDLAFAYLAVGWMGSLVLFRHAPGGWCCTLAGLPILGTYLALRLIPALHRTARDEELFP